MILVCLNIEKKRKNINVVTKKGVGRGPFIMNSRESALSDYTDLLSCSKAISCTRFLRLVSRCGVPKRRGRSQVLRTSERAHHREKSRRPGPNLTTLAPPRLGVTGLRYQARREVGQCLLFYASSAPWNNPSGTKKNYLLRLWACGPFTGRVGCMPAMHRPIPIRACNGLQAPFECFDGLYQTDRIPARVIMYLGLLSKKKSCIWALFKIL